MKKVKDKFTVVNLRKMGNLLAPKPKAKPMKDITPKVPTEEQVIEACEFCNCKNAKTRK